MSTDTAGSGLSGAGAGHGISVTIDQNQYLAEGADTVDAVITVEADADFAAAAPPPQRLEIIIIDCSGSMGAGDRFQGARRAAFAAIDTITDGTLFAVVAGTAEAQVVFPRRGPLLPAGATIRGQARLEMDRLRPYGGTAMGTWIGLARQIALQHPGTIAHAILLSDGKNEHESPERLAAEIGASQGQLSVDCRGVGDSYVVDELRSIAFGLNGTLDVLRQPAELAAEFAAMMQASMGKSVPELTLRVWTPAGAVVRFVKQVAPDLTELTRTEAGPQLSEYSLGAWGGSDDRDYHVQVRLEPAPVGREKLAARISVVAGAEVLGQGLVKAVWTADTELSTRINRRVAHYTGQAELAQNIQEGLAAREQGDLSTATAKLQRAVQLAAESGNDNTAKLLRGVVEVDDHTGTVRLRRTIDTFDEKALDARSTKTARIRKPSSQSPEA
ncbi:vWA domain-containing protein [Nocardia sp. alder85J]|uniref:vWA domain-containing protein n=1 Tax=Nocardia sp. alder85J TaxID=2862949 RepID=UPI001CD1C233|nr:VWA domain-containing protein [Nocardia sp. alder85J]MCX4093266.1 VWA domain-containing protein [Nocardia sp. alder85J]